MAERAKVQISGGALVFLAVLILMLPLKWVGAAVLAAAFHELCHAVAVYILGGRVESVNIGSRGVVMKTAPLTVPREILCTIAGPVGSVCLLLFVRWIPRTAVCGLIQGIYNFIPLFPMDGGRALRDILFALLSPPGAIRLFRWIQHVVLILLCVACVFLATKAGIAVIFFVFLLIRGHCRENPLAKNSVWRYNRGTIKKEVSYDRIAQEDPPHCSEAGPVYRWGV